MTTREPFPEASRDERLSALFAQLVLQQTNMALMLLGRIANPQTGETLRDPEAASLFIDQLEMLEAKTRGNLSKDEEALLKQSLMSLRLAFVEVVNSPETPDAPKAEGPTPGETAPAPAEASPPTPSSAAAEGAAAPKRYSKKY